MAYSKIGDPAGAVTGEDALKIQPLVVDGIVKEWTTGEAHDVTDRSFAVRRVLRINDELPGEKPVSHDKHWVWQRGPWLLVDRVTGHIAPLKLPDYDPGVSQAVWFRDYAAYCGVTSSGKSLYAVVAQVAAHKPVLAKKLEALDTASRTQYPVPRSWLKMRKTKPPHQPKQISRVRAETQLFNIQRLRVDVDPAELLGV